MVTARSTPNIALIKYWGNRRDALRLPAADSCSITLDGPSVEIFVEHSPTLTVQSFQEDGSEKIHTPRDIERLAEHLRLTKEFLATKDLATAIPDSVHITIHSAIPPAIGLASSAAVFSALATAYAHIVNLSPQEVSVIARLGSGSAARSIFGGFVTLKNQQINQPTYNEIESAFAEQIAPPSHWPLFDVIIVPTMEEKIVGSTEGHHMAHTSPLFQKRIETITLRRQQECIDAILKKDFEALQRVTEEDCWDMHNVMQTQTPSLHYLNDETYRIVEEMENLRTREHLPVLYTMDAGPTVHLICMEEALTAVRKYAQAQKNCRIMEAKIGKGATLIS